MKARLLALAAWLGLAFAAPGYAQIPGPAPGGGSAACTANCTFTGTTTTTTLVATTLNGNTFTTGTYTLTGAAAKTLTFSNSLTLAGTDGTTMTFPATSDTLAGLATANVFTVGQTVQTATNGADISGLTLNQTSASFGANLQTVYQTTATTFKVGVSGPSAGNPSRWFVWNSNKNNYQFVLWGGTDIASIANTGVWSWTNSGSALGSTDTGLSRDSPGVVDFGTGAAGNKGGSINATNMTLTGASIILSGIASDGGATDSTLCQKVSDGTVLKGSGTLGICLGTSSERYKHDIASLTTGLAEIMALQPISYRLNAENACAMLTVQAAAEATDDADAKPAVQARDPNCNPDKLFYGFTAEQGGKVLPALMGIDAEGRPNTFDYLGVVPVMVKAIHELQQEIDDLKKAS